MKTIQGQSQKMSSCCYMHGQLRDAFFPHRPIPTNSMISTFCTREHAQMPEGDVLGIPPLFSTRCSVAAVHLSQQIPLSAWFQLGSSHKSPSKSKYKRRITLVAYLFPYLSTCKATLCVLIPPEKVTAFVKVADALHT